MIIIQDKNQNNIKGFSLIELAISLLIISISIIPIVLMTQGSKTGEATKQAEFLSKERSVVNSLMESATSSNKEFKELLNKYKVLEQKNSQKEISTDIKKYPNTETSYRWIFKNLTYSSKNNKRILPGGNFLIDCSLELYDNKSLNTNKKPILTFGTKILTQIPENTYDDPLIGIMLLVDMTPSMAMSSYGWGHNPMVITGSNQYNQEFIVDIDNIPNFNEETSPETVLQFLGQYCNPKIKYNGGFGCPSGNYTSSDDFVFGFNQDNSTTDFDEKFLPSNTISQTSLFASPFDNITSSNIFSERLQEIGLSVLSTDPASSCQLINSAVSRIEMVRSGLYSFVNLIEQGEAGPSKRFKIGFLPFGNTVNTSDLLKLQAANSEGKFPKIKKHIQAINRFQSPESYVFDLISDQPYTTDISTALNLAHKTLIEDETLSNRVIVLITDWNHCIEVPYTIDIKPVRNCIKNIIKEIQEAELTLLAILEQRKENNPGYVLDPEDPIVKKLESLKKTKEWFLKLANNPEETASLISQPYHPLCSKGCKDITSSTTFNILGEQIANGTINQAEDKKTDLYIFGIVDAARPPAASILANVTTSSENGEFVVSQDICHIPDMFYYLVNEMNRLVKLKEAKRYLWNQ